MGLADKFKKGGGGFLNNVDGVIVDYRFTTEPEFAKAGAEKKGDFTPLWVVLTAQVDGAEAPETTHLYAGGGDDFVISEDGHSLSPIEGAQMWGNTAFATFYGSLVEKGLPDVDPEDGQPYDFSHIIGARVRFVQVKDEQGMQRAAKKAGASKGKINSAGQKKGKDGKFYDLRTLQVSEVYSTGNAVNVTPAKAAKGKPAAAPKTKAAAAVADVSDFAEETLIDILSAEKTTSIAKAKLNLAVTRKLVKDERREAVRKTVSDDAFLAGLVEKGVITFDGTTVTLA